MLYIKQGLYFLILVAAVSVGLLLLAQLSSSIQEGLLMGIFLLGIVWLVYLVEWGNN